MDPNSGEVKIKQTNTAVTLLDNLDNFDVHDWLKEIGEPYQWLLAHSYDGVIWGKHDMGSGWKLSSGLVPNSPALQTDELLEMRIFHAGGEIYIWRVGIGFNGRLLTDHHQDDNPHYYYDEPQILWGTQVKALADDFTQLQDGTQGLTHVIPCSSGLPLNGTKNLNTLRPASLTIRHYVERDGDSGLARVMMSRLTNIYLDKKAIAEVKNGSRA